MSHGILLGRSSAWCENAGYLGEIVCCFASLASSVTPGVPTPRRPFNLVHPSHPAQHNNQLCLILPPPSREHACVHPRSPSVSIFFRQPLAGWPSHGTPTPTPTPCEWNAIFLFPLWATLRALVAHCHPPPPAVPLVSRPMYLCFPRMMGYPLRTGTRPDSTPRFSATAPGHGVWGDHFCDVHFVAKFTTLHRPAAAVTPACQPADP